MDREDEEIMEKRIRRGSEGSSLWKYLWEKAKREK